MRTLFNLALGALVDGRTAGNVVYSSEALMRSLILASSGLSYSLSAASLEVMGIQSM
jgi:carbonic anhydrase